MNKFILTLTLLCSLTTNAFAVPVWNYRVAAAGPINGGKLKIFQMSKNANSRELRFKYKLQTVIGYKEDWVPYTLPSEAFDANYLSAMDMDKTVALDQFKFTRTAARSFTLEGKDGRIDFTTPSATSTPWSRITLRVGRIVINGSLMEVTNE